MDDNTRDTHYNLVEEFCPVEQSEGRQALFRVPAEGGSGGDLGGIEASAV
jgi:hypothetical protein